MTLTESQLFEKGLEVIANAKQLQKLDLIIECETRSGLLFTSIAKLEALMDLRIVLIDFCDSKIDLLGSIEYF